MQLYVDLDGVMADFDTAYEAASGVRPSKQADNVDWDIVRHTPDFYLGIPPMADAKQLWDYVLPHDPIILTGLPWSIPSAAQNKRDWVAKHLGAHVPVIVCKSAEKCLHAEPGDILIDDWEKYKLRWVEKGGVWVTHYTAEQSIRELEALGL